MVAKREPFRDDADDDLEGLEDEQDERDDEDFEDDYGPPLMPWWAVLWNKARMPAGCFLFALVMLALAALAAWAQFSGHYEPGLYVILAALAGVAALATVWLLLFGRIEPGDLTVPFEGQEDDEEVDPPPPEGESPPGGQERESKGGRSGP